MVGVRAHPWCDHTRASPVGHCLALVGSWLGLDLLYVSAHPSFGSLNGPSFILCVDQCLSLLGLCLFDYNPTIFVYMLYKIVNLQYKWNYVNSKGICVISLFISPILSLNWWSDLVDKDRQQCMTNPC